MVNNSTLIEKLHRFILAENIRPMKKWSERFRNSRSNRLNWYISKIRKNVRTILNMISGNEIVDMLNDILTKKEKEKLSCKNYENALKNLSFFYTKTNYKSRHEIIRPLKEAELKYSQVRKLGFGVSRFLWETCSQNGDRNKGGGVRIPKDLQNTIKFYLNEKSNIASNRMYLNKDPLDENFKTIQPVRYLEDNYNELYKNFEYSDELSKSTFYKYAKSSGEFKKPFRITDICDYCEHARNLKFEIDKSLKELNYVNNNNNLDPKNVLNILEEKKRNLVLNFPDIIQNNDVDHPSKLEYDKIKSLSNQINDFETIMFHKNIASCQRAAYNKHRSNVSELENKILIEVDFKQRIAIGLSPRQVNSEYFLQVTRSCLGFGIYFVNEQNTIELINFDIISSDLSEDARSVVRGLRFLRKQEFFIQIEKPEYIIWMDCGKHFRNSEVVGYFFKELAEEKISVNLNFFCEKHGKNSRDAHFSCISRFVKAESLRKKLTSSNDIVEAITEGQKRANENSNTKVVTIAKSLDFETDSYLSANYQQNKTLSIQNIESYYNYRTIKESFKLVTSVLSNDDQFLELKFKDSKDISHDEYIVIPENFVTTKDINICGLKSKHNRLNCAITKIKENMSLNNLDSNTTFYNYFSIKEKIIESENDENQDNENRNEKPQFCREFSTKKKKSCFECKEPCSLTMEMILSPLRLLNSSDLNEELTLHGHPSCRIIQDGSNKRARTIKEAADELANHYVFFHKKKWPNWN